MTASWVWASRDLRRRWAELLAVVLLAGLCGGLVLGAVAGARRAGAAVDRYVAHTGDPHVIVFSGAPTDPQVLADLENDSRVGAVLLTELGILFPSTGEPGRDIGILTVDADASAATPWRPWLQRGRLPSPGATDEVAVSESSATDLGLEVGDRVPLTGVPAVSVTQCFSGDPGDCPTVPAGTALVTGVFRYTVDLGGEPDDERMILADQALLDARPEIARAHLVFAWASAPDDIEALVDDYALRVPEGDVTAGDDTLPGVRRATEVQRNALLGAAGIVAAAGLAVVAPAYGRYLARRRPDEGVLRALGMVRSERVAAGVIPGLLAAPLVGSVAVAVAVAVSPVLPIGVARRADPGVGLHADWAVLLPGWFLVTAATAAVAAGAAARWSGPSARGETTRRVGAAAWLAGLSGLSAPARVGTGLAVDPGRGARRLPALPVLAATSAALAVVVASLVVSASLTGLLQTPARFGAPWDLQVAPEEPAAIDDLVGRAAATTGVLGVASARFGELQLRTGDGRQTELGAVGFQTHMGDVAPTVLAGEPIEAADEILVATGTAGRLGLGPGDRVTLSGPGGSTTATVAGLTILPEVGAATIDDGLVVPPPMFDALGAAALVDPIDAQVLALVDTTGDARRAVADALSAEGGVALEPLPSPQAWSLRDVRPVARLLAGTTAALAALAAFHALVTAVRRRRRELGVLRGLGFTSRQAAAAIRWQAATIALVAALVAGPLGIVAGRLVWRSVVDQVRVVDVVDVPLGWLALLLLVMLAGSLLLAAVPARRAARLRPAEVLHDE